MKNDLVSIVIPCYNAQETLAEAIDSCLRQTYQNLEIIVVDDGSSDKTTSVAGNYSDRIKFFRIPRSGACVARNYGLEHARGEYIQFLDADDLLLPRCIEEKVRLVKDDRVVVCCMVEQYSENGYLTGEMNAAWSLQRFDVCTILEKGAPAISAPLHLRSSLVRVGGFSKRLKRAQDYDLHLRLSILNDSTFVSNGRVGVMLRRSGAGISGSSGTRMQLVLVRRVLHARRTLREMDKITTRIRWALACALVKQARVLFNSGDLRNALRAEICARKISAFGGVGAYNSRIARCIYLLCGLDFCERSVRLLSGLQSNLLGIIRR